MNITIPSLGGDNTESKPGIKTTEFWILLFINLAPEIGAIDVGDAKIKGWLHAISVFGYMLSRGVAKSGQPYYGPAAPSDIVDESELEAGDLVSINDSQPDPAPEGDVTKFQGS